MDINRLRYFVALNNCDSMREAAEHLHISQPALSKAMKVLEDELQVQLLVSSGRGVLITDQGKVIAEKASRILDQVENLSQPAHDSDRRLIRIGTFEVFSTYFMGDFIQNHASDYQIQLRELTPGHIEEQIVLGNIDFGITYLPIPRPEIEFIKVTNIRMGILGQPNRFLKQALEQIPFITPITPVEGSPHKMKGLDGWPDNRFPRTIKFQVELMETAMELCRRGLGVAYLPQFVVNLHNDHYKTRYRLGAIPMPPDLKAQTQAVYVIKRKNVQEHALFRKMASALRNLA
jgi:DNA-binding transcriptional LysR family regulator